MFPSIINQSSLGVVKVHYKPDRKNSHQPIEVLITIFNKKHFLQADGTVQGCHFSCSYSDIAIKSFDKKSHEQNPSVIGSERF